MYLFSLIFLLHVFVFCCCYKGAVSNGGEIQYAVCLEYQNNMEIMASSEVFEKWPIKLIEYLENCIVFEMPGPSVAVNQIEVEFNKVYAVGQPANILSTSLIFSLK